MILVIRRMIFMTYKIIMDGVNENTTYSFWQRHKKLDKVVSRISTLMYNHIRPAGY